MPLGLGGSTNGPASGDPFYNFKQWQKNPDFDWTQTPVIGGPSGYLEQNQDATYNRWLSSLGVRQSDASPYAEWLRRQFAESQLGFKSALAEDPTLTYQNYLGTLGSATTPGGINPLLAQWRALSYRQRGLNPSRYAGPVRTISDI